MRSSKTNPGADASEQVCGAVRLTKTWLSQFEQLSVHSTFEDVAA